MVSQEEQYWRQQAGRLRRVVNGFWVLEKALPLLVAVNLGGMVLALSLRRAEWPFSVFVGGYIAGIVAAASYGWWRARPRFAKRVQAFARLDAALGLGGSLVAAVSGVAAWPKTQRVSGWTFCVDWMPMVGRFSLSAGLLVAGLLWPMPRAKDTSRLEFAQPPQAWERMSEYLEALELSELVELPAIEALEERLEALRAQELEDWYSASSLEASDFLVSETEKAAQAFLQALQTASFNATRIGAGGEGGQMGDERSRLLDESLTQLDLGTLPLRPDLLKSLQELARNGTNGQDAQALKDMLDRLEKGAAACRAGFGLPPMKEEAFDPAQYAAGGGPEGGGPAPLTLSRVGSPDLAGEASAISNTDMERAILGDTAYTSTYRSEDYTPAYDGLETSARTEHLGEGGDAVWKVRARPDEQAILKQYFNQ